MQILEEDSRECGGLACLKELHMWGCEAMEKFPSEIHMLMAFERFDFCGCTFLKILKGFGGFEHCRKVRRI